MRTAPETLTVVEYNQLLDVLLNSTGTSRQKTLGLRNFTIATLMGDAGLRVGEVVRLKLSDLIIMNEPVVNLHIRREIAEKGAEGTIHLSERIRSSLVAMVSGWWARYRNSGDSYAFFSNDDSKPLTTRQVERIIGSASKKAFGRWVHPHVLRHSFASRLARVTNIRVVQQALRHKHLSSTQVYTHPNSDDQKDAIEKLVREDLKEFQQNH